MNYRFWTQEEVAILEEMYSRKDIFASDIAARLGRSVKQVYQKAMSLGLKRPWEAKSRAGKIGTQSEGAKAHRFKPGTTPPNKGKKMSPELYAKCAPTMFKKGRPALNQRPFGSERVNVDGYIEMKIQDPNKWALKHRFVWEHFHGPIPEGHNIQFKDGNKENCSLDNLYLISRADQIRNENSLMARYPEDIQKVIRLRGTVKRQITLHNKKTRSNE